MSQSIGMVSLGCAKNQVDAEQMLFLLQQAGFEIHAEPAGSDVVIINTCGFIESAKTEAIDNILAMAALKAEGSIGKILVTGCLAQRYQQEILKERPEVDGVLGTGSYYDVVGAVKQLLAGREGLEEYGDIQAPVQECGRILTTPRQYAYLKIAEGCDNHCAFCIIPALRGRYRSRPMEKLIEEAKELAAGGAKELIVVAQDTSRYGIDLYGERKLAELLRELCKIDGIVWVRVHYLYPDEMSDELIDVLASEPKIVKYLDIPIQHVSDRILKAMNRRYTRTELEQLIKKLRRMIPKLVLRTTVIVGLPGETDDEFAELCSFMQRMKFQRAGVFKYSREEGTIAADMPDQIDEDVKIRRQDALVEIENRVIDKYNTSMFGHKIEVLVEGYDRTAGCYYSRSYGESLDIDGKIFFTSEKLRPQPGEFVTVCITDEIDGDLIGELVAD